MKRRQQKQSISFFAFQDIITAVVGIFIFILLILFMELTQLTQAESPLLPPTESPIAAEIQSILLQNQQLEDLIDSALPEVSVIADNAEAVAEPDSTSAIKSGQDQVRSLMRQIHKSEDSLEVAQQKNAQLRRRWEALDGLRKAIQQSQQQANGKHEIPNPEEDAPRLIYRDTTAGKYLCLVIIDRDAVTIKDAESKTVKRLRSTAEALKAIRSINPYSKHVVLMFKPSGAAKYEDLYPVCKERFTNFGFDLIVEDSQISMGYEWEQGK